MPDDPDPFAPDLASANARHDAEHGHPLEYDSARIRPSWNESRLLRRTKLTDKKIAAYANKGYYSADFKAARRELQERRAKKRAKREGNFEMSENGRLIFRP